MLMVINVDLYNQSYIPLILIKWCIVIVMYLIEKKKKNKPINSDLSNL